MNGFIQADIYHGNGSFEHAEALISRSPSGRVEISVRIDFGIFGRELCISLPFKTIADFVDRERK